MFVTHGLTAVPAGHLPLLCLRASRGTVTVQAVYYNDGQTSTSVVCVALTLSVFGGPGVVGRTSRVGTGCALVARCFEHGSKMQIQSN